jgi:sugar diacid utilization regulator
MSDVQELVDDLAARLERPVGVDDRRFRAVAYSSHVEDVDPVRLASILRRQAPKEVRDWLASLNVERADGPIRVPRNPDLRMSARVCVPIRFDDSLLGYLWLLDEPRALSGEEIERALEYTADLGAALYRAMRLDQDHRGREQELLGQLLALEPGDPVSAAEALLWHGMVAPGTAYAVVAVAPDQPGAEGAPDEIQVRLAAAVDRLRRATAPRHLLQFVDGERIYAVVTLESWEEPRARGEVLVAALEENLAAAPDWSATVGMGGPRAKLSDVRGSFVEAQRAISLGRAASDLGPLVVWTELGAYRTLSAMLLPLGETVALPERLTRLLDSRDGAALLPTLEHFLEQAGDVRATAAELYVHKSSVYQRLRRIEEIAGVDLSSGDHRLELHLGLRLLRMTGGGEPSTYSRRANAG